MVNGHNMTKCVKCGSEFSLSIIDRLKSVDTCQLCVMSVLPDTPEPNMINPVINKEDEVESSDDWDNLELIIYGDDDEDDEDEPWYEDDTEDEDTDWEDDDDEYGD